MKPKTQINEVGKSKFTPEQKEIFEEYLKVPSNEEQIIKAIEGMTLASFTGNVLVSAVDEDTAIELSKKLIREIKQMDNNFTGKVALIKATDINHKRVDEVIEKLQGGALIISNANTLSRYTVDELVAQLEENWAGIVVILSASKNDMTKLTKKHPKIVNVFNLKIDLENINDSFLVKYGIKYAYEQEYVIDDLGLLALHTQIANLQTASYDANKKDVEKIIDRAIKRVDKKNPKHFMDVLLGRRYGKEDMIILKEEDF